MKNFLCFYLSCLTVFGVTVAPAPVHADDYGDAPLAAADRAADIGSVYLFLDPNDNNFAVAAVTIGGFIVPSMNSNLGFFDSGVRFVFAFENTGDAATDFVVGVTHSAQTSRTTPQTATVEIKRNPLYPSGQSFNAMTTISRGAFGPPGPPTFGGGTSAQQTSTVTTDPTTGISYFGGLIDDPFFFDMGAELAYRSSRFANQINPAILTRGRDSFAGYNTMAIILRMPVTLLRGAAGSVVGLSVSTQRDQLTERSPKKHRPTMNIDRMGNPFINNIFTSYPKKDAYNAATPADDAAGVFLSDIDQTLQALQTNATFRGIIESVYVTHGDLLRLDTSIPNTGTEGGKNPAASWPNGRRPNDDVIDTILTLVNNGVFQGDAVNDNELPMPDAFPFFAQPHMPFPPGAGAEDLTRN